jgi:DNA-binding NarL/FixJ family response regulator
MTIRVFLLDSHESVREGLRVVLDREDDMEIAGEADTVTTGLARIEATRPDVVLADLMLSDGGTLGVCLRIKARRPGVACLVLGAHGSDGTLSAADRADAPGFLLTRTTSRALFRLIRFVATGGSSADPVCSGGLDERFRSSEFDDDDVPALRGLSPQERRLLDHLAEGLTNPQIADRMNLSEKTVKNYVSNLLRKLNAGSRTEAAVFVTKLWVDGQRRRRLAGGVPKPRRPPSLRQVMRRPRRVALSVRASSSTSKCCR